MLPSIQSWEESFQFLPNVRISKCVRFGQKVAWFFQHICCVSLAFSGIGVFMASSMPQLVQNTNVLQWTSHSRATRESELPCWLTSVTAVQNSLQLFYYSSFHMTRTVNPWEGPPQTDFRAPAGVLLFSRCLYGEIPVHNYTSLTLSWQSLYWVRKWMAFPFLEDWKDLHGIDRLA